MRILVADDDAISRLVVAATLSKCGHEAVQVEDGEAAWRCLQAADPPKLALLDWMMPKMDGLEVIRRVRSASLPDPPYLILLTALGSKADRIRGLEAGADDHLSKPFDPAELRARIKVGERLLNLQTTLSRRIVDLDSALAARSLAEEAFLQEQHYLHSLMDYLPDCIYFKDTSSHFTRINRAGASWIGLDDPREAVGKTDFDFFSAEHAQAAFEDEQEIIRTGTPMLSKEEKETWPDGRVTWVVSSKMPLLSPAGDIVGTFGVSHDITKRKEAEESNRFLASVVEASDDGIYALRLDGTVASWNPGAEHIYGYAAAEVLGKSVSILIPPDRPDELTQILDRMQQGAKIGYLESERLRKDGCRIDVALTCSPIKNAKGEVVGAAAIVRDITASKRAERELLRNEAYLAAGQRLSHTGSWAWKVSSGAVFWSEETFRIFGFDPMTTETVDLDAHFLARIHPEDRPRIEEGLKRATTQGAQYAADYRIVLPDGAIKHIHDVVYPVTKPSGEVIERYGVVMDVTERKRAEEELSLERNLLRTLIDSLPDSVFVKDTEGRVVIDNVAHQRQLGAGSQADVAGKTVFDYFPSELASRYSADEEAVIASGRPLIGREEPSVDQAGNPRWLLITKVPLKDTSGKVVGIVGVLHDITDQKLATEELYQSRQLLQAILDSIPQRVFWKDRNSTYLGCNRPNAIDAGLQDPSEIVGKTDYDLVWKDIADLYRSDDKLVMEQNRGKLNFEEPQSRPDGSVLWLRTNKLPLRDRSGAVIGVIGTYEDITEQKRAEEQLQKLSRAVEQSPASVVITDRQGKIEYVNPTFTRLTGYTWKEIIGKNPSILKSGLNAPETYRELWQTLLGGGEWRGELANRKKSGELYWEFASISPIKDAQGNITHFIAVKEDVTERKQAEKALRESEFRFRRLAESNIFGVFSARASGLVSEANDAFLEMVRYSKDDLLAGTVRWDQMTPAEFQHVNKRIHQQLLSFGVTTPAEIEFIRKDGSRVPVLIGLASLDASAEQAIGFVLDLSQRKKLEIELRHAQKLQAVGQLAAGIAHEINTPIQFVGDNTRFVQEAFVNLEKLVETHEALSRSAVGKVEPGLLDAVTRAEEEADWEYLKAEVPKALDQTLDGVKRVAQIVRAMKDFSHVDHSGEKAAADLNKALESTLVVARNEIKYVADVVTEFGDIPPVVCNLGDLNQVFLNLLINAAHAVADVVKGNGAKGTIGVKTWQEGEQVVIAIRDTGTGIPAGICDRVFEPFFTTKEVGKGTGQGLALARSAVVNGHRGSLTFDTETGKGTTFYVRLPIGAAGVQEV